MENNSKFYSPLRYPGGKSCIFPFVSNLFYENRLLGINYAEPYAGGAGLALRLLFEEFVDQIYINDLDKSIYAFWNSILTKNLRFCDWLSDIEISVDRWLYYKDIQNRKEEIDEFELAKSTFFLNRTNVSGVIKGGIIGGLKQKGKYKINARFNKDDLIRRIRRIEKLRKRITLSNLDGLSFIKKIDRKKEDFFIYLDPPYYQKGADLYMNFFSKIEHQKLSKQVHKIKKRWMVSYDNHDFILNLYPEKDKVVYKLSQSASNRIGNEVLIFPDSLNFEESLNNLNTPQKI